MFSNPENQKFLEELYTTYNRLVYSEVYKYVATSWDADDVVQTVFINLFTRVSLLKTLSKTQMTNYIIVVSRNTAMDYMRNKVRTATVPLDDIADQLISSSSYVDDRLDFVEFVDGLCKAWDRLDERTRYILNLKYIQKKTNDEIAREIGVGKDSIRVLISRAKRKLKQNMHLS